jgi:cytochrome c peroxidase
VELTYPYFHDGSAETLEEAVSIMGESQLGRRFNDEEVEKLVAFLKTLTGEFKTVLHPVLPR